VRCFVQALEEWMIRALERFGVKAERREGRIGVWVPRGDRQEDKIAAIGVRVRRWVTYHGVALNVAPDLTHFQGIVPCGIAEQHYGVTSLRALGIPAGMAEVDEVLREAFDAVFEAEGAAMACRG
jgi:lipoyl(octanoyl) transferase